MKEALLAFAAAWLPPWLERRACKSVHVSLCEKSTFKQENVACGIELSCCGEIIKFQAFATPGGGGVHARGPSKVLPPPPLDGPA